MFDKTVSIGTFLKSIIVTTLNEATLNFEKEEILEKIILDNGFNG